MNEIKVDGRAGSDVFVDLINSLVEEPIAIFAKPQLSSGDIAFKGRGKDEHKVNIVIEVKSLSDLVSSTRSNRLQTQVRRMIAKYDVVWVITYGVYQPKGVGMEVFGQNSNTLKWKWRPLIIGQEGINYAYYQSICINLLQMGVCYLHLPTKLDIAEWTLRLYLGWQKKFEHHDFLEGFWFEVPTRQFLECERPTKFELEHAKVLAALPGIGWKRGLSALRHFGSVVDAMVGEWEDWDKVDGIGELGAKNVVKFLEKEKDE